MLTGFEDDLPQMPLELLRAYPNSLEWWYFDLEAENGADLVVILSRKNPLVGVSCASVSVEFQPAAEARRRILVRDFPLESFAVERFDQTVTLRLDAGNTLTIVGDSEDRIQEYRLRFSVGDMSGEFRFAPLCQGFKPGASGVFFSHRQDAVLNNCVNFAAPRMNGSGEILCDGERRSLSGQGYHDHPWGTDVYFNSTEAWHWGRLMCGDEFLLFVVAQLAPDYEGALRFALRAKSGEFEPQVSTDLELWPEDWGAASWWNPLQIPHGLRISCPAVGWQGHVQFERLLLSTPFYCRSAVSCRETHRNIAGHGWTEYFRVPDWCRGFMLESVRAAVRLFYRV